MSTAHTPIASLPLATKADVTYIVHTLERACDNADRHGRQMAGRAHRLSYLLGHWREGHDTKAITEAAKLFDAANATGVRTMSTTLYHTACLTKNGDWSVKDPSAPTVDECDQHVPEGTVTDHEAMGAVQQPAGWTLVGIIDNDDDFGVVAGVFSIAFPLVEG